MEHESQDRISKLEQKQAAIAKRLRSLKKKYSVDERKRRTRRLILLGTVMERWMDDAEMKRRVHSDLEDLLDKDVDRLLFKLAPLSPTGTA